ncbi:hypothetical protein LSCM1_05244 [Leishmania martiniquensis]|uniref:Uncharacterized protein n=1 Tax=Leishmania martiniquensis TaxID=1580590 RepID=A0A836GKR5_9TRYP|nr:hypothetical protein LSCM1_05244 [Leishmania martiniquensis]
MCTHAPAPGTVRLVAAVVVSLICSAAAVPVHAAIAAAADSTCGSNTGVYYRPDGQVYRGLMNVTEGGIPRQTQPTSLVAVVSSTYSVPASYTISVTAPPLSVYPPFGTYVGSLAVLVNDPQPPATCYMYVYQSSNWVPLSPLLFPWTATGTSELDICALHLKDIESAQRVVYEVAPAVPPTSSLNPSIAHHRPVNVTCAAPLGAPVPLSVYRDAVMQGSLAEEVFSVVLSAPGAYTVTCTYADGLQATRTTTAVLRLVAVPMPAWTFTSACGDDFPAIALSLLMELNLSNVLPGSLATSWFVSASVSGGARIPNMTRSSEPEGVLAYGVFRTKPIEAPATMEVHAMAHSLDPLKLDSRRATCACFLYPQGTAATPHFLATLDCATTSAPVRPSCIMTLKRQLASGPYFYSAGLLPTNPASPILTVCMTGFGAAIQSDMQHRGVLLNLRNETGRAMVLATSWKVVTPTPMAAQVYTFRPATIQVKGFHADAGAQHLVRDDYSCEDTRVLPEVVYEGTHFATHGARSPLVEPSTGGFTDLAFRVPIAGWYKLYGYFSDTLYEVPFSSSDGRAATAATSEYLHDVAQPFSSLAAIPQEACGGFVPSDMEGAAFSFSMAAAPAGAFASLATSHHSAEWASMPFPANVEAKLGGAASVGIGPLNRYRQPWEVLDASLGPTARAAQPRAFFVSAAESPLPQLIKYLFYKVSADAVPPNLTGVMLLLQGRFRPGELIVIDIYESATPASGGGAVQSSLHLLRRVTARPSVATAYEVALPDFVLGLPAGEEQTPYLIYATLDGRSVEATPSIVALSPVSLAMTSCASCSSQLCNNGQCLCKNKITKVIHVCGTDSSDTGDSHDHHIDDSSASSSAAGGEGNQMKPVSVRERLTFLFAYLGLLAGIAGYILISIKRGGNRRGRGANAADIAVHNS